jgi:serine O-acetyltransferase
MTFPFVLPPNENAAIFLHKRTPGSSSLILFSKKTKLYLLKFVFFIFWNVKYNKMSWNALVEEGKSIIAKDEFMSTIIKPSMIDHDGFPSAVVYVLADHYATERIPAARWISLFSTAYSTTLKYEETMGTAEEMGLKDLVAVADRDPASDGMVNPFLHFKGFKAIQAHRIAHILWKQGRKDAARAIQSRCSDLFDVDIHPAAIIGKKFFVLIILRSLTKLLVLVLVLVLCAISIGAGFMIDHGTGVVIGETATIGDNCSFLHGVTLGSTGKDKNDRHPKIGNDVLIGCNATLLGNISIGDSCKIGSGSLVLKPLPAGVTAVGNPARIIGRSMCAHAGEEMDTAMDNVVNAKGVKFSDTYNVWADSEADMFYI